MTTIVGIKTNSALESIVIVADRQISSYEDESKGAITKLYAGKNWVMGDVGDDDREITNFYHFLKGHRTKQTGEKNPEKIIEEAIKTGRFMQICELNAVLSKKARGNYRDGAHTFLLAVNKPSPSLWLIDQWGNLIPPSEDNGIDYFCLGSGEDEARRYIQNAENKCKIDRDNLTTRAGIETAIEALEEAASLDLKTGMGFDSYVITRNNIEEISKKITKSMIEAGKAKREEIYREFDKLEAEEENDSR